MTEHDEVSMAGPELAIRVAEIIRLAHARSGLHHDEIAARLNVSVGRVSQILNGDGNFHIATVARILAAMDCKAEFRAADKSGEKIRFVSRRRHSARPAATPTAHDAKIYAYQMSITGEEGGFEGVFLTAASTPAQTLAGGRMAPVPKAPTAHASPQNKFSTTVELTKELADH